MAAGEPRSLARQVRRQQEANEEPAGERVCGHFVVPKDCPTYLGTESIQRPSRLKLSFRTPLPPAPIRRRTGFAPQVPDVV